MSSSNKISINYFPFAPGIPWKISKNFILNEIPGFVWSKYIEPRKTVIVAHGELIESFFSLSIVEAFNIIYPQKQIYWCGKEKYKDLLLLNGLSIYNDFQVLKEEVEGFTTPIFFDRQNDVYFNCLNNYLYKKTFDLKREINNSDPIFKQIFSNSLMLWDHKYLPKIRKDITYKFNKWCINNKFYKNNPYVFIIPEKTEYSQHKQKCLGWDANKVKALSSILYQQGINTVVCSNNVFKYKNSNNFIIPVDLELIFNLIQSAKLIISEDIDYLLISLLISDAKVISKKIHSKFSLEKNLSYLNINKYIHTSSKINVSDISKIIKERA